MTVARRTERASNLGAQPRETRRVTARSRRIRPRRSDDVYADARVNPPGRDPCTRTRGRSRRRPPPPRRSPRPSSRARVRFRARCRASARGRVAASTRRGRRSRPRLREDARERHGAHELVVSRANRLGVYDRGVCGVCCGVDGVGRRGKTDPFGVGEENGFVLADAESIHLADARAAAGAVRSATSSPQSMRAYTLARRSCERVGGRERRSDRGDGDGDGDETATLRRRRSIRGNATFRRAPRCLPARGVPCAGGSPRASTRGVYSWTCSRTPRTPPPSRASSSRGEKCAPAGR